MLRQSHPSHLEAVLAFAMGGLVLQERRSFKAATRFVIEVVQQVCPDKLAPLKHDVILMAGPSLVEHVLMVVPDCLRTT